jgi:hypothetical protein
MKPKDIFMYALACLVVVFTMLFFTMMMFHEIPTANRDIINIAAGVFLGAGYTQVLAYFFSTSKTSAEKSVTIDNQLNNLKPL